MEKGAKGRTEEGASLEVRNWSHQAGSSRFISTNGSVEQTDGLLLFSFCCSSPTPSKSMLIILGAVHVTSSPNEGGLVAPGEASRPLASGCSCEPVSPLGAFSSGCGVVPLATGGGERSSGVSWSLGAGRSRSSRWTGSKVPVGSL